MINILFGWLTKPNVLWTPLDQLIFIAEAIILLFIICVLYAIWEDRKGKKK